MPRCCLPAFAFHYAPAGAEHPHRNTRLPAITQASPKRRERVLRSGATRPIIASDAHARTGGWMDK